MADNLNLNVSLKISFEDLRALSREQCVALMQGIALVVSANPYEKDNEQLAQRAKAFARSDVDVNSP
jgi:hypothetical protein